MSHTKKSFAGAGIGIIIFIFCYKLLPPPDGSSLSLRTLWLLSCPVTVCVLGFIIAAIAGLITWKRSVFIGVLSSFIFFGSIIYASCCLVFPDELKTVYTRFYVQEKKVEQAKNAEKRDKAIKKAIEENIQEQKRIPKPVMEKGPLKLVIKEAVPDDKKKSVKVISTKNIPDDKKTASEEKPLKETSSEKIEYSSNSPFDYGAEELGGYFPVKGNHHLPDVSIKGILILVDGESVAALRLKNKKRSFYVREGNVIRFHEEKTNKKASEVYLQVRKIKNNEVEIIQQQRPDKIIIIR